MSLLALPAAALAQSAGDEQYADPFGETDEPSGSQERTDGARAGGRARAGRRRTRPGGAGGDLAGGGRAHTSATGLPVALLASAGAMLLASGAALRRRVS